MREIKFRAWGIHSREFLRYFEHGKDEFGLTFQNIQAIESIKDWEFTQYTGLKDKNGVEIYEGDLLNRKIDNTNIRQVVWNEQGAIFYLHPNTEIKQREVNVDEFNSASSVFSKWFTQKFYEDYESDYAVEVIGNIYENPELLK